MYTEGLLESILGRSTYKQVRKAVQTYLGDIVRSVTDHHNTASHNIFADGASCHQFVKNATSLKGNKVKHNKMRCACIGQRERLTTMQLVL